MDAEVVRANMQLPVVRTVLETGVDRDIVEKSDREKIKGYRLGRKNIRLITG